MSSSPRPLRSVVYGSMSSFEHFMLDGASRTLCGKRPGHINPGLLRPADLPTDAHDDYCRSCFRSLNWYRQAPSAPPR